MADSKAVFQDPRYGGAVVGAILGSFVLTYLFANLFERMSAAVRTAMYLIVGVAWTAVTAYLLIVIFSSLELGDQAEQRWRALGIWHERVGLGKFHEDNQQKVNADVVKAAFEVADKSIDTARLCRKLVEDTVRQGRRIFTDTRLIPCDSGSADMERGEEKFTVTAGLLWQREQESKNSLRITRISLFRCAIGKALFWLRQS